jgi:NADH:ubiquinone oxidoreductase subunit F (NADH-binding)/(2Fe-2S) ferredoxin/NAD-dependent dihydropyrimidine dehydrogenase PreA subunit
MAKRKTAASTSGQREVLICCGSGCPGSEQILQRLKKETAGLGLKIKIKPTGCHGFCQQGPTVLVQPDDIFYCKVTEDDVKEIVQKHLQNNVIVERLLYSDLITGEKIPHYTDIKFFSEQKRVVLRHCGSINPERIEEYIASGGYKSLKKVLTSLKPAEVVDLIKRSGLRGRGGAGFPTGTKWEFCHNAAGEKKYMICNADEGDPGAFMDRSLLEGNPHSVLEGLIIGAYATGAHEGFIYVRQEYPLAVENVSTALEQARKYGLLGKNILGSGFDFDVKIHRGAGAFVSGESSALMTAIEGKVGEPRPKYIRTAVSGVWERPSNLNNVETWANVPLIINKGADWFTGIGTPGSKGTKIFSLVGKVNNTGLVEVPMGMSLRDIIYKIGGGIPKGKKFKAVQTGGPSGGCLPESLLDLPVDFDELTKAGSMMGSGGMIVMDEDTCMVDVARYFLDFLADESCGKCVPCRLGIEQMVEVLNRICQGKGRKGDIELLEELCEVTRDASLCALGQTAPNPVQSTIRYFRDEYEAHIDKKRCPAGVCKALISYYIDPQKCSACGICLRKCPVEAISGGKNLVHIIDQSKCTKCRTCFEVCPPRFSAVVRISGEPVPAAVPPGTEVVRKKGTQE